ncbi:MAG TPA: methylated-DNA--[protein]-cysteine S-methyltransferase [Lamprocystis sp. (in: g-proteobacteria)]|nr:methylated-DNA--[protein]-cysteine S-methyltransferase [Lamprocystis sp. (in: g-proteobacteria)]
MPKTVINAPLGPVELHWAGETLSRVVLEPDVGPASVTAVVAGDLPGNVRKQLAAYLADGSACFDLALDLPGTAFQQRVWAAIRTIPPGETRTYRDLARQLGSAPRAVGQACRANPCPIVVPCHRVVAVNGLGGFAGDRSGRKLAVKRWLLRHEGVRV